MLDWMAEPLFSAWMSPFAGILVGIVIVAGLLSLLRAPTSGPVTNIENHRRIRKAPSYLLHANRIAIICLGISLILIYFPFGEPIDILLVSRASSSDTVEWNSRGKQLLERARTRAISGSRRLINVEALVEAVLSDSSYEIKETMALTADEEVIRHITNHILSRIEQYDIGELSSEEFNFAASESHAIDPWVVESIEIAVLKGLVSRYNVSNVYYLATNRAERYGWNWDAAEVYLGTNARGENRLHLEIVDDRIAEPQLRQVVGYEEVGDSKVRVTAIFHLPSESFAQRTASLQLNNSAEIQRIELMGNPGTLTFVTTEFSKPNETPKSLAHIETSIRSPIPRPSPSVIGVRIVGEPEVLDQWSRTFSFVTEGSDRCATPVATFQEMKGGKNSLGHRNQTAFRLVDFGGSEPDVVIDIARPSSVWVVPQSMYAKTPLTNAPIRKYPYHGSIVSHNESIERIGPIVLQEANYRPGQLALDRVVLAPTNKFSAMQWDIPGTVDFGEAYALEDQLAIRYMPKFDSRAIPIELLIPLADHESGLLNFATQIGLDFREQSLLLEDGCQAMQGFDPDRFVAVWSSVLDSVRSASITEPMSTEVRLDPKVGTPMLLLTHAESESLHLQASQPYIILAGCVVILYALLILSGLNSVPRKSSILK